MKKQQIESYLKGKLTQQERAQVVEDIRNSSELDYWFRAQMENTPDAMPQVAKDRVWERIHQPQAQSLSTRRNTLHVWKYAVAACGMIILMVAAAWVGSMWNVPQQMANSNTSLIVRTGAGERSEVVLPDGTEVALNAMTRVSYDCAMADGKRRVKVEGEAYFNVAKDEAHPFVIDANQMEVTCLGTALNVRDYADETTSSVVLVEGKVRVTTEQGDLTMEPNSRVVCDKQSLQMSKSNVQASNYTCWLKGETRYNDQTLADITRELARSYHINIIITNDELREQRFTGYLGSCSLKSVLDILTITSDLAYQIDGDAVYIYARNTKN